MADVDMEDVQEDGGVTLPPQTPADSTVNGDEEPSRPAIHVQKPIPYTFDLGRLLVVDANPLPPSSEITNAIIDSAARDCAQSLLNQLLTTCPIRSTSSGVLLTLPAPTTPLPRSKPVPAAKTPTKWEQFAAKKGIKGKAKDTAKKVYDEEKGEWVPKWGYKGKNKDGDTQWLVEVDDKKEKMGDDQRQLGRAERKERIRRQQRAEKKNERNARENRPRS